MTETASVQHIDRTRVLFQGKKLIFFAGCDYLRMSCHPAVTRALTRTVREAGLNVAASRLTTGNHALYGNLEEAVRRFFSVPRATLVQAGYMADLVAAQALAGRFSHALLDSSAHPALRDASQFLNCPVLVFPSRSPEGLAKVLKRCGPGSRLVLLTDGMFSRDGSVAPLREYLRILPKDALLFVDDAHGAGVLGERGGGSVEHCGISRARVVQTVTLSKAFGVYGGAILSDEKFRRWILEKSIMFAGSTPLPLPLAGAAIESIGVVSRHPELRVKLHQSASRIRQRLIDFGFDISQTPGPIFALAPRTPAVAKRLNAALLKAGIYPSFSRYSGTPRTGLFRFVFSSEHTAAQLDRLADTLEPFSPADLLRP